MCPLIQCIKRCFKKKHTHVANPFQDVKLNHYTQGNLDYISVVVASVEKLEPSAIEKTIAELIAIDMIRKNLIEISETTTSESNIITYSGRLTIKVPGTDVVVY